LDLTLRLGDIRLERQGYAVGETWYVLQIRGEKYHSPEGVCCVK
jgi:hypothetical protein